MIHGINQSIYRSIFHRHTRTSRLLIRYTNEIHSFVTDVTVNGVLQHLLPSSLGLILIRSQPLFPRTIQIHELDGLYAFMQIHSTTIIYRRVSCETRNLVWCDNDNILHASYTHIAIHPSRSIHRVNRHRVAPPLASCPLDSWAR